MARIQVAKEDHGKPDALRKAIDRASRGRMVDGYNLLRDALSWFDAHEVEKKLGHLPQWVPMARELMRR